MPSVVAVVISKTIVIVTLYGDYFTTRPQMVSFLFVLHHNIYVGLASILFTVARDTYKEQYFLKLRLHAYISNIGMNP